jgi:23S rRNA pseudouridine1911/1915/1917 synthase
LTGQRPARTRYRVLERFPAYNYLSIWPETGRTHQIRVHLKAIGHPVAGDKLYGPRNIALAGAKRQLLHASGLNLVLPDGGQLRLETELPPDFAAVLAALRRLC